MTSLQLTAITLHLRDIDYCVTLAKVQGHVEKIMYHTKAIKLLMGQSEKFGLEEYDEFIKKNKLTNYMQHQ